MDLIRRKKHGTGGQTMRLIDEADVVKAIDKHTQPDGTMMKLEI